MWDNKEETYTDFILDYDPVKTVAMAFPLFFNISTKE